MSANEAVQDGEWSDSVCRLCLSKDGNESVFHRGVQTEVDLAERIFQCVSIRISKENPLPVVVCHECIHFVNEWHKFREKCHKMQTVLLSRLKDLLSSHTRPKITSNGLENAKEPASVLNRQAEEHKAPTAPTPLDDGGGDSEASSTTAPPSAQPARDDVLEIPDEADADEASLPPPQEVDTTDEPTVNGGGGSGETDSVLKRALEQNREDVPRDPRRSDHDDDEVECVSSETLGMSVDSSEATHSVEATPEPVRTHGLIKPKSWSSSKIRIESTVTLPVPTFGKDSSMHDDRTNESRTESDMDRSADMISQPGSSGFHQSRSMDMAGLISPANVKAEPVDDYSESFDAPMSDDDMPNIKQEDDGTDMDVDFNLDSEFNMSNLSARDLADICRLRGDDTVSIKGIKCLVCRHKFSSLHSLLRHTSSQTHLIAKDFTAKMKSGLLTPAAIALHNKRMLAFKNKANRKRVPGQPFMKSRITCRTCNRAFISKRELMRHEEYYKHGSFHPMVRPRNPPLLPALSRPGQMNVIQIQRPPMPLQSLQQRQFAFQQQQQVRVQPQQPSQANILSAQFRLSRPQVTIQPAGAQAMEQREYICPIPNCNYICTEGSVLLTHMTSHGINQKAQQLQGGASIQRKIIPQQSQQGNPYALQYRQPPQNRSRPSRPPGPPPTTRDFYCPFHHVYFNSARGYLNHARVCRRCPPLPPSRRSAQSGAQVAQQQQLAQNHVKKEPEESSEAPKQSGQDESQDQAQTQSQPPAQEEQLRNCKLCNLRFASHQIFLNHMQAYHKNSNSASSAGTQPAAPRPKPPVPAAQPLSQRVLAPVKLGRKWACSVCNKVFNFSYALKYHMKIHQTASVPTCKVCKQTFNTMKTCLTHLKTHFLPPGSKLFFCTSCHKAYDSRSVLAKHRYDGLCSMDENSMKITAYTCNSCEASYDTLDELNQHKIDRHEGSNAEPEGEPGKDDGEEEDDEEGAEGEELAEGEEGAPEEEGDTPMEDQTAEGDEDAASGSSSKQNELQSAPVPTYCKVCDKNFSTYQNLKRHCKTSHSWSEAKIKEMIATYAPVDIKNEPTEDGGDQAQASGQSAYSCEFCNATFTLRRILTLHVNNFCHNSPSRPRCDRCGEPVMKNKPCENCLQLDEQMQGDPDQEGQDDGYQMDDQQPSFMYKCPIGNMSFMDESAMVQHYSYCTGNCPALFKCAKCNAEFKYKKSFEAHHCGYSRKPTRYHCSDCNRTFSRKNYLLNHKTKCPGYPQTPEEQHLQQQQQRAAAQRSSTSAFPRHFMAPTPTQSVKKTRQSGPVDDEDLSSIAPAGGESGSADLVSHACPDCPKVFFCQKALIGHEYIHKGTPEDPMFCRFCGKQNMLLEQLYTHTYKCLKSLFRTEEILSCDQCNLAMSRYEIGKELAAKVNRHVLSCYPIPFFPGEEKEGGEKLLCYLCCHAFSTAETLAAHKITHKSHLKGRYRRTSPFLKPSRKRPRPHAMAAAVAAASAASSSSANTSDPSTPTSKADYDPNDMMEEESVSENETTSVASSSDVTSSTDLSCGVCGRRFLSADKLRNHEKVHGIVRENVYDEEDDDDDLDDGELDEAEGEDDLEGHDDAKNEGEGEGDEMEEGEGDGDGDEGEGDGDGDEGEGDGDEGVGDGDGDGDGDDGEAGDNDEADPEGEPIDQAVGDEPIPAVNETAENGAVQSNNEDTES